MPFPAHVAVGLGPDGLFAWVAACGGFVPSCGPLRGAAKLARFWQDGVSPSRNVQWSRHRLSVVFYNRQAMPGGSP